MNHIVNVGDLKIGCNGDVPATHALGSCLGRMVFDPAAKVGGLLHAMRPLSGINPQKAQASPAMLVDTGAPLLFNSLWQQGAVKGRLVVKAAGCGSPTGKNVVFKIGARNYWVLKKPLWKNNILLESEDVGGTNSRTIHFDVSSGQVTLSRGGTKRLL